MQFQVTTRMCEITELARTCWDPRVPQKFWKSHWCVPFTATFSKRRKIGALWSERCDAPHIKRPNTSFSARCKDGVFASQQAEMKHTTRKVNPHTHTYIHTHTRTQTNKNFSRKTRYPEGCAAPSFVPCQCYTWGPLSKLERTPPQIKINVTSKSPVGDISVVTLIRTDTTLDHSQKAEKVCNNNGSSSNIFTQSIHNVVFHLCKYKGVYPLKLERYRED